jgi:mRNA-degrading endonuclease RelE of RelBE toxin-antitoxin system
MPPAEYRIQLTASAEAGLASLDRSEQIQVVRQFEKLKRAPELGEPLGTKYGIPLSGYRKLYAARKRIRVIYTIQGRDLIVLVVAVGAREDARVYRIAEAAEQQRLRRIR